MADFIQSANVKSTTRTLAEPIVDVATFNTIVQSVITRSRLAHPAEGNSAHPVQVGSGSLENPHFFRSGLSLD